MASSNCADFCWWLQVSYEDNQPADTLREISGDNANINAGFGGSCVWIRRLAAPAGSPGKLMSNLFIAICDDGDNQRDDDLAKGAGGSYRYLDGVWDGTATHYITDLALWRHSMPQGAPPPGWHGKTDDINGGRGGDNLYVVWKIKEYTGPR